MTSKSRLLETMPARAIDLRPGLACAVDTLSAIRDTNGARAFAQIAFRVDMLGIAPVRRGGCPGCWIHNRVLFGAYCETEVKIDGEERLIIREEDILGVLRP